MLEVSYLDSPVSKKIVLKDYFLGKLSSEGLQFTVLLNSVLCQFGNFGVSGFSNFNNKSVIVVSGTLEVLAIFVYNKE